jgi:hypothetical protein
MNTSSPLHAGPSGTDTNKLVGSANGFEPTGGTAVRITAPCLTCELKLWAPKSIARGRGPTCHRRYKAAQAVALAATCSEIPTTTVTAATITGGQR